MSRLSCIFKLRPLVATLVLVGLPFSSVCVLANEQGAPTDSSVSVEPLAEVKPDLPTPLTLPSLLALPYSASPQVLMQQAQAASTFARASQQDARNAIEIDLQSRLGWREYENKPQDNHMLALHIGKELYDFGKTTSAFEALQKNAQAEEGLVEDRISQYQLRIMRTYLSVLLADMQYRVENEAMAVAYVEMDKAKDRLELSRISEVEYFRLDSQYQAILVKREKAAYEQRRLRAILVNMVGQHEELPDKLALPNLKAFEGRNMEELKVYQDAAIAQNLQLKGLRLQQEAALTQIESEQAGNMPTIRADAWGGKLSMYENKREGSWRFDLSVDVPLYDGGMTSAKVSQARAELQKVNAQIALLEQNLRDDVAQVFFNLELSAIEKRQSKALNDYSDLYLDLSRAMYENESTTDLGDAMVRVTEANLQVMQQTFTTALNWAQLDYLTGQKLPLEAL